MLYGYYRVIIPFLVGLLLFSGVFSSSSVKAFPKKVESQVIQAPSPPSNNAEIVSKIDEIAQQITIRIDSSKNGNGSGVIVAKEGNIYYVLTADHVVKNPDKYEIVTPDKQHYQVSYETIKTFEGVDLALLQFTSQKSYSLAILADYQVGLDELSQDKDKRQLVFLSGFPGAKSGNNKNLSRKLTAGIAFPLNIALSVVQNVFALNNGYELIYTNLSQRGMSGGPLLDSLGRVVGINAAVEADVEVNNAGQVEEINLGRSLGVPIRTFLGLAGKAKLNPKTLKVETSAPQPLNFSEIDAIRNNLFTEPVPSAKATEVDWLNYGNQLWRLGNVQEANEAFDRAIGIKPDFYQAYYAKGLALIENKQYLEALAAFEKAAEIKPSFYEAWRMRANILNQIKKYPEALASIEKAIEIQPEDALLYLDRGDILLTLKRYEDAVKAYTKSLKLKPSYIGYFFRGYSHLLVADYQRALADFDRALKLNPRELASYITRGNLYGAVLDYQAALADLNQAAELAPDNSLFNLTIYFTRGITRSLLGDHQGAIADCNKLSADKYLSDLLANSANSICKAHVYFGRGDYQSSIANANIAIEGRAMALLGYHVRGLVYINLGNFKEAIADYDKILADLANNLAIVHSQSAYMGRAMVYAYLGNFDKALIDADRAIEIQPKNPLGYFYRGFCRSLAQNYQGAIADANKAIEIQPKYAEAYALRGGVRAKVKDWQGSLTDLDRSLDTNNNSIVAIGTKGAILYEMGNTEEAIKLWQKATEINQDPVYLLALSVALSTNGERDRALKMATEAISSNQNLRNFESFRHLFWGDLLIADTQKLLENID